MANIEIYTKATCPFCIRAKALLNSKGVTFHELPIDGDAAKREEMIQRSGRTTVPQIFIDAQHIGGCDDLYALDSRGGLDPSCANFCALSTGGSAYLRQHERVLLCQNKTAPK